LPNGGNKINREKEEKADQHGKGGEGLPNTVVFLMDVCGGCFGDQEERATREKLRVLPGVERRRLRSVMCPRVDAGGRIWRREEEIAPGRCGAGVAGDGVCEVSSKARRWSAERRCVWSWGGAPVVGGRRHSAPKWRRGRGCHVSGSKKDDANFRRMATA
ncbi:hypothetical protein U1Q18_046135, partial [Sarracenia purpurea var. burkii]